MKRVALAILLGLQSYSIYAQYIPPMTPDMTLPSSVDSPAYWPIKTSTYGYDNVSFHLGGSWVPQNLYVYSWTSENHKEGGISWIRRDPGGAIQDTGWISVPGRKFAMTVGIVQDRNRETYVIASYLDYGDGGMTTKSGYKYECYHWGPSGLSGPGPETLLSTMMLDIDSL